MQNYIYSDLALEGAYTKRPNIRNEPEFCEEVIGNIKISKLCINTKELSKIYEKAIGTYVTLTSKKIWLMHEDELENMAEIIGNEIFKMMRELLPQKELNDMSVLVVGLGNSDITPDAIGPLTVSHLTVTRHIATLDPKLFSKIGQCAVSAFIPGVLAQTGIETLELIRGAVQNISPDIVIAVDALAARSCERLAATVQLSDAGITPGSGIGNTRKAINKKNLGIPVIALGVPTVVDSATLVYDSLEKAGIEELTPQLQKVLKNGRGFFVSPKECDVISDSVGLLLARSLDRAFCVF